jgi:hypothetical protein
VNYSPCRDDNGSFCEGARRRLCVARRGASLSAVDNDFEDCTSCCFDGDAAQNEKLCEKAMTTSPEKDNGYCSFIGKSQIVCVMAS